MRVVSRGKPPDPDWVGRFRCKNCQTVIETDESDVSLVKLHRGDPNDQREYDWYSIACPTCGKDIPLMRWNKEF